MFHDDKVTKFRCLYTVLFTLGSWITAFIPGFQLVGTPALEIDYDATVPQLEFATRRLRDAFESRFSAMGSSDVYPVRFTLNSGTCAAGGFEIVVSADGTVNVSASDVNGLMYGGLELAEQLSLFGEFRNHRVEPFIAKRASM